MLSLAADEGFWVYARVLDGEVAIVALNTDAAPVTIEAPLAPVEFAAGAVLVDRLESDAELVVDGGRLRVTLPPMSSAIFTVP